MHNLPDPIPWSYASAVTPRRLHQLQAFSAVLHGGSVTRAAEMLSLTQPAVTKLLRALEDETGLTLFDRRHRRLIPTHEALRFEQEVARLFAAAKRVDRIANDMRGSGLGELRVAALPMLGVHLVPRLLARFARQGERIRVSMTMTSSIEVHDLVQAGQADLGFALPVAGTSGLAAGPPLRFPGVLALPPGHRLGRRRTVELGALEGEPYISLGRQYWLRDMVDEHFERHGVAPVLVAETQNAAAACEMVAEGLGFTIVDIATASAFRDRVRFAAVRPGLDFPVQVLAPPGRKMALLAEQFLALVAAELPALAAAIAPSLAPEPGPGIPPAP